MGRQSVSCTHMSVIRELVDGIGRQHLVLLGLVVLVALAGCSGADTGDGNETTVNGTATPVNDSDGQTGENGSDGEADSPDFGSELDSEVTPASDLSVSKSEVVSDAIAAQRGVDEYQFTSTLNVTTEQNNVVRSREIQTESAVDRENRTTRAAQDVTVSGQSVTQDSYLVDGTLYQRSEVFTQQYGSEWIRQNVSGNYSEVFKLRDELGFHRALLENGSASLEGAQTVDGERTYRLRIESNGSAFAEYFGVVQQMNANLNLTTVVWVDAETGHVVRSEGRLESTTTAQGRTVTSTIRFTDTFEYTDVDITLPEAAETAVTPEGTTAG